MLVDKLLHAEALQFSSSAHSQLLDVVCEFRLQVSYPQSFSI